MLIGNDRHHQSSERLSILKGISNNKLVDTTGTDNMSQQAGRPISKIIHVWSVIRSGQFICFVRSVQDVALIFSTWIVLKQITMLNESFH